MHIRRQKAAFAAAVKAFAVQRVPQKLAAAQAGGNSVSQLYFTTCTWLLGFQGLHHVRREDVTPNHAPVRRGVFGFGFFYDGFNLQRIAVFIQRANDAVLVHFRQGHFFYRQHSFVGATVYFSHLRQCARGGAVNQIIGQQHCERLIGLQQIGCTHYRMPQAQRLRLAHVKAFDVRRYHVAYQLQCLHFAFGFEFGFQFRRAVEVINNGVFAAACDEYQRINTRFHCLIYRVLNQGAIHHREHFFRYGFGGGQKAAAQACYGEYGFAKRFHSGLKAGWVFMQLAAQILCFVCAARVLNCNKCSSGLHMVNHHLPKGRAAHLRGTLYQAGKVVGNAFAGNGAAHAADNQIGSFAPTHMAQHHFG